MTGWLLYQSPDCRRKSVEISHYLRLRILNYLGYLQNISILLCWKSFISWTIASYNWLQISTAYTRGQNRAYAVLVISSGRKINNVWEQSFKHRIFKPSEGKPAWMPVVDPYNSGVYIMFWLFRSTVTIIASEAKYTAQMHNILQKQTKLQNVAKRCNELGTIITEACNSDSWTSRIILAYTRGKEMKQLVAQVILSWLVYVCREEWKPGYQDFWFLSRLATKITR